MGSIPFRTRQPKRDLPRALGPLSRLSTMVQPCAAHGYPQDHGSLQSGRTAAGPAFMSSAFRIPDAGRIDRSRPCRFHFNGQPLEGYAGDTLASALLANGVHLVGRSYKYHRPRGILSAGSEESNALIQLERGNRTEPNLRATQIEIYEGLVASSQNAWPSVETDVG